MKNFTLLFCCLLFSVSLLAQKSIAKNLEGTVVSKSEDIAGVHVINLTNEKATITSSNGFFSIAVSINDTLVFSAVQYKKVYTIVTQNILLQENYIVYLRDEVTELDEVVLDQRTLVTAESLGLPNADVAILPQSERLLYDADHGKLFPTILSLNFNKLLNRITGRTKMLKARVARDQQYARSQEIRNSYADSIFITDLKIPKLRIEEFMLFCEADASFSELSTSKNDFIIWDFLIKKSIAFQENDKLETIKE